MNITSLSVSGNLVLFYDQLFGERAFSHTRPLML